MSASGQRFRTHLVPDVLAYVALRGGEVAPLLARCGLQRDAGEQLFLDLTLDGLEQFLDGAASAANDPALGLHVGMRLKRKTWDVLQLSCRSAPTLGDALLRIPRLMPLLNDSVEIDIEAGPEWQLHHRIAGRPQGMSRHGNELWLAALLTRAREETQVHIVPTRCWFGHAAHAAKAALREVFETDRLDFGAGSTGLSLRAADLRHPLVNADPVLSALLDRLSTEALQAQGCRRGLSAQVYRLIREELDGELPAMSGIARRLGMSERSLQRHLEEEGTSYRALIDQVRRDGARLMLSQNVSRDEIARRLAYAETASFTRSLARWTRR